MSSDTPVRLQRPIPSMWVDENQIHCIEFV